MKVATGGLTVHGGYSRLTSGTAWIPHPVALLLSLLDLRAWRSTGRFMRVLRAVLLLVATLGMTPAATEVIEAVEHVLHDGHLPHGETHDETTAEADHGKADEHGCSPTQHHCPCCASLAANLPSPPVLPDPPPFPVAERTLRPHDDALWLRGPPLPPLRPPIS